MEAKHLQSVLESLFFLSGEGLLVAKLAQVTGETESAVQDALEGLREAYSQENRGVSLILHEGRAQMVTRPENASFVEKLFKSTMEENLSKAALEVLSVIAYRGPVTRADIEAIRGVNCSFTLRNLLLRGLIEREEGAGQRYVYTVSLDCLRSLGLSHIENLPEYARLRTDERLGQVIAENS